VYKIVHLTENSLEFEHVTHLQYVKVS